MPVTLVSSSFGSTGLGVATTAVITAPTAISAGNLLVAEATGGGGSTISPPAGWTIYNSIGASGNNPGVSIYWKIATGSETSTYTFTLSTADGVLVSILNISGANPSSPINGFFTSRLGTAAETAGSTTGSPSIPSTLNCLPIAFFTIQQLLPSNAGSPASLTSGWTSTLLNVVQDSANFFNGSNGNGYNTTYIATGPLTSSTSSPVVASCTWGGSNSNFASTNVIIFVAPLSYGTLSANPSSVTILGPGTTASQQVTISESSYTGAFTVTVPSAYQSIVSVATTQTGTYGTSCVFNGPIGSFWIQELSAGNFQINVSGG